ncbi:hypothetical protein, partial [Trichormus variabilis]
TKQFEYKSKNNKTVFCHYASFGNITHTKFQPKHTNLDWKWGNGNITFERDLELDKVLEKTNFYLKIRSRQTKFITFSLTI